jgi:hypothetical protein
MYLLLMNMYKCILEWKKFVVCLYFINTHFKRLFHMKRLIYSLVFVGFLFAACEGPVGPQGNVGPVGATGATGAAGKDGANGKDGTNGANGKDGTSASARYYDFELDWTSSSPRSTTDFRIPNFKPNSEYPLVYCIASSLYYPLPIDGATFEADGKTINIVDMKYSYGSSGLVFLSEWNYLKNGPSTYKFRVVVAPMVAAGRLAANTPYEVIKAKYGLKD